MDYTRNPKVVGAFLVGLALVTGAYVLSDFGQPRGLTPTSLYVVAEKAPTRLFIPVTDDNNDGLEDWRDQFMTAPAVTLKEPDAADYVPPETLTDQFGIALMEGLITSMGAGPVGKPKEQVVTEAVDKLGKIATADKVYDVRDITLSSDSSDAAIRNYGNALANIIILHNVKGLKNEILLLQDYLDQKGEKDNTDLVTLANVYKNYRDDTLQVAVPRQFAKQHLDLINVYNALYLNIDTMSEAGKDPLLPYVRLKRYEDDVEGLALALQNMYNAFVPHAKIFDMNDSAMLLVNFSRDYQ